MKSHVTLHVKASAQGPVAQSLVSANRWLRGIKTYRFPWHLTLVSANHASSNPGQKVNSISISNHEFRVQFGINNHE